MNKLFTAVIIAASMMSTTAVAYEAVNADEGYIAKRGQVQSMISYAHYSAQDRGVATVLINMADRARNAGLIGQANDYIAHAQVIAAQDLKQ